MKKYSWDLQALIKKRNEIQTVLEQYEELLYIYNDLIDNYDTRITSYLANQTPPNNNDSFNHKVRNFRLKMFNKIQTEKLSLVTGGIEIASKFSIKSVTPTISTLILSDEQLIAITGELFKQLPNKYFYEQFKYYTDPNNHLLHIRYHKKLPTTDLGLAITDPKEHKSYGLVSRYNSVQDIISNGHEIMHMIVRSDEKPLFCYSEKGIYTEVEGFFANLLFTYMLRGKEYDDNELDDFERSYLQVTLQNIIDTFIVSTALNKVDDIENINFKDLRRCLKQKNITPTIFKKNFLGFLNNNFNSGINYTTSYLIALDLFEQYKTDPEKVLDHLLNITTLTGEHPKQELESMGVNFFEDGYINLEEKCKKLLKEKPTSQKK